VETNPQWHANGGPVAMAQTSAGTLYLYDASRDDMRAYLESHDPSAVQRVRRWLPRVASRGASGMLADDQVAALEDGDVEGVIEQYLTSPGNQKRVHAVASSPASRRAVGESAVAYFDRLLRMPADAAAPAIEGEAMPMPPPAPPMPLRAASWAIGALAMGVLLSGLAALFSYRAYEHEQAMRVDVDAARAQLLAAVDRRAGEARTQVAALRSENAALRERLENLERLERARRTAPDVRPTRSPARSPEGARKAAKDAKSRDRAHR
jgi:hypothetical protein